MKHKEALEFMKKSDTFSIEYRSFNRQKRTGGKLMQFHSVRMVTGKLKREDAKRATNHFENFTFDVEVMVDDLRTNRLQRIHLPFVTKVNDINCYP